MQRSAVNQAAKEVDKSEPIADKVGSASLLLRVDSIRPAERNSCIPAPPRPPLLGELSPLDDVRRVELKSELRASRNLVAAEARLQVVELHAAQTKLQAKALTRC